MNIALVDNDKALIRSLQLLLTKKGHCVRGFHDSLEALKNLTSEGFSLDMLIVDYVMPGMTGLGLVRNLAGHLNPTCRVVLLSGHSKIVPVQELASSGIHQFLAKPVNLNQLFSLTNPERASTLNFRSIALAFSVIFLMLTSLFSQGCLHGSEGLPVDSGRFSGSIDRGSTEEIVPVMNEVKVPGHSLSDIVRYAQANNPEVQSAYRSWQASVEFTHQAGLWPDPRLSFGYFLQEIETRRGPQQFKSGVTQAIPWAGKLKAEKKITITQAAGKYQGLQSVLRRIKYQVSEVYYRLVYRLEEKSVLSENLSLVQYLEDVVRTKYTTGGASQLNVIDIQIIRAELENRILDNSDGIQKAAAALRNLLSTPELDISQMRYSDELALLSSERVRMNAVSLDHLVAVALASNPGILQAESAVNAAGGVLGLAKYQKWPELAAGIEYIHLGSARYSSALQRQDPVALTLSISLPFHQSKYRSAVKQAALSKQAVKANLESEKLELKTTVETTYYAYREMDRKNRLLNDTVLPQLKQALEIAEQSFIAGQTGISQVVDLQRKLLNTQLESLDSLIQIGWLMEKLHQLSPLQEATS